MDTLSKCPWCEIEAATGVSLFPIAMVSSAHPDFTIAAFWAKVNSVPNPGPPPPLPRVDGLAVALSPAAVELRASKFRHETRGGFLALIGATSRIQSLKNEIKKNR